MELLAAVELQVQVLVELVQLVLHLERILIQVVGFNQQQEQTAAAAAAVKAAAAAAAVVALSG